MNSQMASAVLEMRAVTTEPESLAAVAELHRVIILAHERIVGSDYIVRCTLTHVCPNGHKLVCAVSVQPIGPKPEHGLQNMLRRACVRFRRIAQTYNVGCCVTHSTYDQYIAKGNRNVKETKSAAPRTHHDFKHSSHFRLRTGETA